MRLVLAIFTLCAAATAQDPTPEAADLKVRVGVNLVQVDAVVTDAHGNHVTDLSPDDFVLMLDGEPQTLKVFDVINVSKPGLAVRVEDKRKTSGTPPTPQASIKPADVRRTIVLFVDDLSLSADRVPMVRKALHEVVDKQIQPGDLVGIVRASAGLGALTDFTTDKDLLRAAADQVRWNSSGKGGMLAYKNDNDFSTSAAEQETRLRAEYFATAVVESLRRLVNGMSTLPGRKSVVILSNSLPLSLPEYDNGLGLNTKNSAPNLETLGSLGDRMLHLADAATRASVVFYAIDTRLLATPVGLSDASPILSTPGMNPVFTNNQAVSQAGYGIKLGGAGDGPPDPQIGNSDYRLQRGGGMFLSSQTGGFMLYDTNNIGQAIGKVLDDSNGYYLLGFTPPEDAFEPYANGKPKFHRTTIDLRRPGLHVRSRSGFFGESGNEGNAPDSKAGELLTALDSPFRSDGVGVRVTCSYLKAGRNLPSIRASMIVRAQDLTLEGPVYNRSAIIHLLIRAYGVNGADLDRSADKVLKVSLNEEGYQRALKFGLVYAMEVEVAKPGPYRVRVALRDESSGRVGTAGQYLVVPNLNGRKLALSGLVFSGSYGTDDDIVPASAPIALVPGSSTRFAFEVFGAKDHSRSLQSQVRLFRDGIKVYESPIRPLQVASKLVHGEGFAKEELQIPGDLPAGDYALQEDVMEQAGGKTAHAWQWADLQIGGGETRATERH